MHELKHYIEKFSSLNTAKVKGHRAPHKAVLLLAVIDLVEERKITSPCIDLSDELIERFNDIWHKYLGTSAIFTPDICKPYFHMQHESFWRLVENNEVVSGMAAEPNPWVQQRRNRKTCRKAVIPFMPCAAPSLTQRLTECSSNSYEMLMRGQCFA